MPTMIPNEAGRSGLLALVERTNASRSAKATAAPRSAQTEEPSRDEGPTPLVSIVTPTLNRAQYLNGTLESVESQTYSNIEHLVVDGGSTDGTLDLLSAHEASTGLRWISEPDRGMYDAINKGLRLVTGDIVAYLNSDDLYLPWAVRSAVDVFTENPDVDVVFGDLIRFDEVHGRTVPVFVPRLTLPRSAAFGNLSQPATFLRRAVIESLGGFDTAFAFVADADLWFRAAGRYRFARISEFIAIERWHAGALSTTRRSDMALEDARMRGRYRRGLWAHPIGRLIARQRYHAWSGLTWLRFFLATRGMGRGWGNTIKAGQPSIAIVNALVGIFPSKGSRLRAGVRWQRDPVSITRGT
jgi:glycosyltransferase involved in cell wall biosynthesis